MNHAITSTCGAFSTASENYPEFAKVLADPTLNGVNIEDLQWSFEIATTATAKGFPVTVTDVLAWVEPGSFNGDASKVEAMLDALPESMGVNYCLAVMNLQQALGIIK